MGPRQRLVKAWWAEWRRCTRSGVTGVQFQAWLSGRTHTICTAVHTTDQSSRGTLTKWLMLRHCEYLEVKISRKTTECILRTVYNMDIYLSAKATFFQFRSSGSDNGNRRGFPGARHNVRRPGRNGPCLENRWGVPTRIQRTLGGFRKFCGVRKRVRFNGVRFRRCRQTHRRGELRNLWWRWVSPNFKYPTLQVATGYWSHFIPLQVKKLKAVCT